MKKECCSILYEIYYTVMFFSPAGKNVLLMFSMNENYAIVLGTMYMIFAKLPLHNAVIPCSRGTPKQTTINHMPIPFHIK